MSSPLFIRQYANAALELHSEGITHTDIRPENVQFLDGRTFEEMVYQQSKFVPVVGSMVYGVTNSNVYISEIAVVYRTAPCLLWLYWAPK